ncbi:MAG: FG-GAP repeat protein [Planctomycetes bacterium]|nr:FG-GAP repeat protein [Planctomycetota bacterium]
MNQHHRLAHVRTLSFSIAGSLLFSAAAAAQTSLYTKLGTAAYDHLGASVRSCGDVNNDGRNDFIAGAPQDGNIFGGGPGYARIYSGLNGNTIHTFNGVANDDRFGAAVDGAGDVNGDGFADALIGAPGAGAGAGAAYIRSGANGAILFTFNGAAGDGLGSTVAGIGDVNNDGVPDVIVASATAPGGGTSRGTARVYSGMTGALLTTINGAVNGDRLGISADNVGDVNGDGRADFVIGSYFAGAKVYSGATFAVIHNFPATTTDDRLGFAVAGGGDVNGDGVNDVLVGAPQDGNIFSPGNGFVRIYSGATGGLIRTLTGGASGDRFGIALANARDMNADGRAETIVGADQNSFGGNGYARVFRGSDGAVVATINGLSASSGTGVSVDGLGDLDTNGSFEVIVGQPNHSVPFSVSGRAEVWSITLAGGCAAPFTYCVTNNNSTGQAAVISSSGSSSVAANTFTLMASNCPASTNGLFYYGTTQVQIPFGAGNRCVNGTLWRLPIVTTTPGGTISHLLNFPSLIPPSQILPGSTWNFQFWFRDSVAGPGVFNTTNALSATFCN